MHQRRSNNSTSDSDRNYNTVAERITAMVLQDSNDSGKGRLTRARKLQLQQGLVPDYLRPWPEHLEGPATQLDTMQLRFFNFNQD